MVEQSDENAHPKFSAFRDKRLQNPDVRAGYEAAKARRDADEREQCDHWNDRLPGGVPLRPLRCRREAGHPGQHQCGDTSWSEALGTRIPPGGSSDE